MLKPTILTLVALAAIMGPRPAAFDADEVLART